MPYRIAIVNNAQKDVPEHWAPKVSQRRQRALKLARRLKSEGNRNIMLFHEDDNGTLHPVSLSQEANLKFVGATQGSLLARKMPVRQSQENEVGETLDELYSEPGT